jgi:hypothetical protein
MKRTMFSNWFSPNSGPSTSPNRSCSEAGMRKPSSYRNPRLARDDILQRCGALPGRGHELHGLRDAHLVGLMPTMTAGPRGRNQSYFTGARSEPEVVGRGARAFAQAFHPARNQQPAEDASVGVGMFGRPELGDGLVGGRCGGQRVQYRTLSFSSRIRSP